MSSTNRHPLVVNGNGRGTISVHEKKENTKTFFHFLITIVATSNDWFCVFLGGFFGRGGVGGDLSEFMSFLCNLLLLQNTITRARPFPHVQLHIFKMFLPPFRPVQLS